MADGDRTAYSTTQVLGLGLITASLLVVVVVALILFDGEDVAFFAIVAAVGIVTTFLVWRFDRLWARILGVIATIALVLGGFFLAFGVFQPFSPIEFTVGVAYVLGVLVSLYGGIRALIAARRDTPGPTPGESRVRVGVFGVIGVAALISIVGFFLTRTTVSEAEAAGATPLDMTQFEFDPFDSSVPAGGSLLITNSDPFAHDFTLDDLNIYVHFGPGSEAIVDLSSAAPGNYQYFCSLHSDGTSGMRGAITIES